MADEDACEEYKSSLSDLTCNSKPLINMLTMLAEDNVQCAQKIVQVIENHLTTVSPDVKLPVMYLIDSIIKNVGTTYLNLFTQNIVSVFCSVFEKVDEKTRIQLFKLRQTWSEIFPAKKMYGIDVRVRSIDPAWPITAQKPQSTIHLNPKFLDSQPKKTPESPRQTAKSVSVPSIAPTPVPVSPTSDVRQQVYAKQQELLKLHQLRLEMELSQAKDKLEEQARQLQIKDQQQQQFNLQQNTGHSVNNSLPQLATSYSTVNPSLIEMACLNHGLHPSVVSMMAQDPRSIGAGIRIPGNRDPRINKLASRIVQPISKTLPIVRPRVNQGDHPTNSMPRPNPTLPYLSTPPKQTTTASVQEKRILTPGKSVPTSIIHPLTGKVTPLPNVIQSAKPKNSPKKVETVRTISPLQNKLEKKNNPISKIVTTPTPTVIDLTVEDKLSPKTKAKSSPKNGDKDIRKKDIKSKRKSSPVKRKILPSSPSKEVGKKEKNDKTRRGKRRSTTRSRSRSPVKKNSKMSKKSSPDVTEKSRNKSRKDLTTTAKDKAGVAVRNEDAKAGDVDLRVVSKSSIDQRRVDSSQKDVSEVDGSRPDQGKTDDGSDSKENSEEPPKKIQKTGDLDSLFGGQDQDYRLPPPGITPLSDENEPREENQDIDSRLKDDENSNGESHRRKKKQKNWAQYKAVHPDEYKSPIRPGRDNYPANSNKEEISDKDFRIGQAGVDRLGRPLLNRFRPDRRSSRSQDAWLNQEDLELAQASLMLEKQDDIIREAEQHLRAGIISPHAYHSVLAKFQSLEQQHLRITSLRSSLREQGLLQQNSQTAFPYRVPPSKPILIDGEMRKIKFYGAKAVVFMDQDQAFEVTFTGSPKSVFLDDCEMFTLDFGGQCKEFALEGRQHNIRFGAPCREVYLDGIPYEVSFGGNSIPVQLGGKVHHLRLGGPPPNVELSSEPIKDLRDLGPEEDQESLEARRLQAILPNPTNGWQEKIELEKRLGESIDQSSQDLTDVDMRVTPGDRLRLSPNPGSPKQKQVRESGPDLLNRNALVPFVDGHRPSSEPPKVFMGQGALFSQSSPWNNPRVEEGWNNNPSAGINERRPPLITTTPLIRPNFQGFHPTNASSMEESQWKGPDQGGPNEWDWRTGGNRGFPPNHPPQNFIPPFQQQRMPMPGVNLPFHHQGSVQFGNRGSRSMGPVRGTQFMVEGGRGDMLQQFPHNAQMPQQNYPGDQASFRQGGNQRFGNQRMNRRHNQRFDQPFIQDGGSQGNKEQAGKDQRESAVLPGSSKEGGIDVSALLSKLLASGLIQKDNVLVPPAVASGGGSSQLSKAEKKVNLNTAEADGEDEKDRKVEPVPPIELAAESLKGRYLGVISILYRGTQCASCGLRFKDSQQEKYSQHLDWHFRANRREKDGVKKAFSRKWFYDVEDWIQFEEIEDLEDRARSFFELQAGEEQFPVEPTEAEVPSVTASQDQAENACVVCSEPFQLFWVEEEEEWHLKGAIRKEGKAYHPLCYEDFLKASLEPETPTIVENVLVSDLNVTPTEIKVEPELVDLPELNLDELEKDKIKEDDCDETTLVLSPDSEPIEEVEPTTTKEMEMTEAVEETEAESLEETEKPERIAQSKDEEQDESLKPVALNEEIIGLISESEDESMEDEGREDEPETKMVVLPSGGSGVGKIVMKVKAQSMTAVTERPGTPQEEHQEKSLTSQAEGKEGVAQEDEEWVPPADDPRFEVQPPINRGKELSGLCSIM